MVVIFLGGCRCEEGAPALEEVKVSEVVFSEFSQTEKGDKKEEKLFELIEALEAEGEALKVVKWSEEYLSTRGYWSYRMHVSLMKARALEKLGRINEASVAYGLMWGTNTSGGMKWWMMPSLDGWCRTTWKRNQPATKKRASDRQLVYEKLHRYIEMTHRLVPKMNEETQGKWKDLEKMLKRFEESGEVEIQHSCLPRALFLGGGSHLTGSIHCSNVAVCWWVTTSRNDK